MELIFILLFYRSLFYVKNVSGDRVSITPQNVFMPTMDIADWL